MSHQWLSQQMSYLSLFVLLLSGCFIPLLAKTIHSEKQAQEDSMKIVYRPIGLFHTELTSQTGAPRQGILQPENKGTIEVYPQYQKALRDLEKYDYIIVLYHMHLSKGWHTPVRPPRSSRTFGLFASRSPNRPNSIGMSVIKLEKIEGNILHVTGIDAFDRTPVLDIKPWIPSIDCPGWNRNLDVEKQLGLKKKKIASYIL
ncbi:MAG: tRNA (N6-threonylcarbamoyladenosine(37)-N6)-methyltransferase TrmO [Candidatus Aminicenantaceae bacterium]